MVPFDRRLWHFSVAHEYKDIRAWEQPQQRHVMNLKLLLYLAQYSRDTKG